MKNSKMSDNFGKIQILESKVRELEENLQKSRNVNMILKLKLKNIREVYLKGKKILEE
jgi:hypothetical protein